MDQGECLREIFIELDPTSDLLELAVLPSGCGLQPRLRFTTYGLTGITHFDLPQTSDYIEVFECTQVASTAGDIGDCCGPVMESHLKHQAQPAPQLARFRFSLLKPAVNRSLNMASRVSMRLNQRGFLSMQYMIPLADNQVAFVEFFVTGLREYH
ncbi:unnamed protein product [Protopolystoma xenopodis]|uniref:Uncharacterized protein n=1 Tax=Protopolystoma xenopodis TaxID=117903 RepID=A0A3S5FFW9_9PLAT|nr:unnamed protein product [Protopolystoma xenopodis]